jgi:UDP-N-acetylglucosamine--N-acetylmuramyl-(pentapeptide) pyrophosphoryl-undecaprenol N-acetylglucosamine transferase
MKIIISGGGTGGHIYPGIAIARALMQLKPEAKILFVGGKGQRESKIIPDSGFDFVPVLVQSFPRKLSFKWLKVMVKVPAGFFKSLIILSKFKPDIAIGTGGYVCGPVLLAAWFLRIPIVIQEQNAFPGVTSKILGRWAKEIYVPFVEAVKYFPAERTKITGNPIRKEVFTAPDSHEKLGLDKNKITITIIGGSQGARSINSAVIDALKNLSQFISEIQIIHSTGESDFSRVQEAYKNSPIKAIVQPYFYNIEEVYAGSNLVVCRSGAMTLAEISACGLPAILIPYPYAAEDHQTFNAKAMEDSGAAIMIKDDQLTGELLAETIISLIKDKKKFTSMAEKSKSLGKPNAAQEIAESIISLVVRHEEF